jgi:hypothetical protein
MIQSSGPHDITIANVEIVGPGYKMPYNADTYGVEVIGGGPASIGMVTLTNVAIHGILGAINNQGYTAGPIIVDHNFWYDLGTDYSGTAHPDVWQMYGGSGHIMRFTTISNWGSEGMEMSCGDANFYMHDCVWTAARSGENATIFWPNSGICGSGSIGPVYIYNNVFAGPNCSLTTAQAQSVPWAAGSAYKNNIEWNLGHWGTTAAPGTSDHNFSDGTATGTSGISGGSNPFVNSGAGNYRIVSTIGATYPRDKGVAIAPVSGQTFNVDADGNVRGADGSWDIGAYEYGSISTNPVISVSPASLAFGALLPGQSATNYFIVQNLGSGTLAGSATISGASTNFSIVSGQSYSLGASQSAQVAIRYSPNSASDSAVVTFSGGGLTSAVVSGGLASVLPGLSFQSYAGVITAPFTTNGGYVSQTVDVSSNGQAGVTNGGRAVYAFNISTAGNYTVSASVNAPNSASKSVWVNMDVLPTDPTMIWDVYPYTSGLENRTVSWRGGGTATNNQFAPQVFTLSAGTHQLIIVGREPGVQLGRITVAPSTPKPLVPQNLRIAGIL